ncbi:hypothetical protein [Pseudomonas paeninsulae]|nr:hypothetical protein [Pseudomonas sp. IT1137]
MARLGSHHIQIHARLEVNQLMKLTLLAPSRRSPFPAAEHLLKPARGV